MDAEVNAKNVNAKNVDLVFHLPHIGLLMALAWSLDDVCHRAPRIARAVYVVAAGWAVALAIAAFAQTVLWSDDYTLFSYTVARAPNSSQARYILGTEYLRRGDLENAEKQFRASVELTPQLPEAFNNLGVTELQRGDAAHAAEHFSAALSHEPANVEWLVNYGTALLSLGRRDEGRAAVERALRIAPDHRRARKLQEAYKEASTGR